MVWALVKRWYAKQKLLVCPMSSICIPYYLIDKTVLIYQGLGSISSVNIVPKTKPVSSGATSAGNKNQSISYRDQDSSQIKAEKGN